MSIVIGVLVAIASLAVVAAYMLGRSAGIKEQKETTLGIIKNNTKQLPSLGSYTRDDAATIRDIRRQANAPTNVFRVLFNISDEELAEMRVDNG